MNKGLPFGKPLFIFSRKSKLIKFPEPFRANIFRIAQLFQRPFSYAPVHNGKHPDDGILRGEAFLNGLIPVLFQGLAKFAVGILRSFVQGQAAECFPKARPILRCAHGTFAFTCSGKPVFDKIGIDGVKSELEDNEFDKEAMTKCGNLNSYIT